jgi:uncharacterized membrane protein (UPF0127 family)
MNIKINNNKFKAKVVTSPEDRSEGMMFKNFDGFDAMLFIMDKDEEQSFWMKNCKVPLDIVFISRDTITKIHSNCQPCKSIKCPSYEGNGNIVLELPGGVCRKNNIKVGDKVVYLKNKL